MLSQKIETSLHSFRWIVYCELLFLFFHVCFIKKTKRWDKHEQSFRISYIVSMKIFKSLTRPCSKLRIEKYFRMNWFVTDNWLLFIGIIKSFYLPVLWKYSYNPRNTSKNNSSHPRRNITSLCNYSSTLPTEALPIKIRDITVCLYCSCILEVPVKITTLLLILLEV